MAKPTFRSTLVSVRETLDWGIFRRWAARLTLAVSAIAQMLLSSSILKSFNILSLPDICGISKMIYQFGGIAM